MHHHRLAQFRRRLAVTLLAIFLIGAAYLVIAYGLNHHQKKPAVSQPTNEVINGGLQTFRSIYFQFQDTGKWVLKTQESTADKFIYYKYRGLAVEHQLIVYVNQEPIPLYLAVSRVLPVRIVNNNSFDATSVSGPCGSSYAPGDLHKVKIISIDYTSMLCDPDTPQFSVVLAQINGDYKLHLQRLSGASVQFVITYRDLRLNPGPDTIVRIANSFQAI